MPLPLDDPAFPHGEARGYGAGCRATYPCPKTPSCADDHAAKLRIRRRSPNEFPGQAKTTFVRRRLLETLDRAGEQRVREHARVTRKTIQHVLETNSTTISFDVSARLDAAWAWFIHDTDVTADGYPHGTITGYHRKCRCRPCNDASTAIATKADARRAKGLSSGFTPVNDKIARKVTAHTRTLVDQSSIAQVARAAGVGTEAVRRCLKGKALLPRTSVALLETTHEQVAAATVELGVMDGTQARFYVRTMWALGYPLKWQAEQAGISMQAVCDAGSKAHPSIVIKHFRAIEALARRVGDTLAGPDDGVHPDRATRARNDARRAGWYPPAAYDDNGNLDPRAIPGNAYEKADEWAMKRLIAVRALAGGTPLKAVARTLNMAKETVGKRVRHGLTYEGRGLGLDVKASAPRIRQIMDVWHAVEAAEYGPVTGVLILDIHPRDYYALKAWKDHPEVLAWLAAQEADTPAPAAEETSAGTQLEAA